MRQSASSLNVEHDIFPRIVIWQHLPCLFSRQLVGWSSSHDFYLLWKRDCKVYAWFGVNRDSQIPKKSGTNIIRMPFDFAAYVKQSIPVQMQVSNLVSNHYSCNNSC
eukprot:NODE_67_length_23829_cov_0.557059.p19 type:complete len:107 gc:universal NODE_67_length_23829_cov_0.557059:12000-11680(-)